MNVSTQLYTPKNLTQNKASQKNVSFTGTSSHAVAGHRMEYTSANLSAGALSTMLGVYAGFVAKGLSKIKTPLATGIGLATAVLTFLVTQPLAKHAVKQQIARKESASEFYNTTDKINYLT